MKGIDTQENPFVDVNQLDWAKGLIKAIEQDDANTSFTTMIDKIVMNTYSLAHYKPSLPCFYTNDRMVISTILTMVVERPDGVINSALEKNIIGIYRDFNFEKELKFHFSKEKKGEGQFDGLHLGVTPEGPTNRVVILLKVETLPDFRATKHAPLKGTFLTAYPLSLSINNIG
ncbi:MAG: hypothetical protein K0R76_97 [Alphaproteobacteria bacterium]|jgi:hypothetical protein|nr:hypothetical protein [Alphaproteobacteria bacterium]